MDMPENAPVEIEAVPPPATAPAWTEERLVPLVAISEEARELLHRVEELHDHLEWLHVDLAAVRNGQPEKAARFMQTFYGESGAAARLVQQISDWFCAGHSPYTRIILAVEEVLPEDLDVLPEDLEAPPAQGLPEAWTPAQLRADIAKLRRGQDLVRRFSQFAEEYLALGDQLLREWEDEDEECALETIRLIQEGEGELLALAEEAHGFLWESGAGFAVDGFLKLGLPLPPLDDEARAAVAARAEKRAALAAERQQKADAEQKAAAEREQERKAAAERVYSPMAAAGDVLDFMLGAGHFLKNRERDAHPVSLTLRAAVLAADPRSGKQRDLALCLLGAVLDLTDGPSLRALPSTREQAHEIADLLDSLEKADAAGEAAVLAWLAAHP